MTHVQVDLDQIDWSPFLLAQEGGGAAAGLDGGSRYFQGARFQRGFGLLGTMGRFLMPIVRNLATTAGTEAVQAGKNVLEDVAKGRSVREALTEHGAKGLQNVAGKLQQCGKGGKRRPSTKRQRKAAVELYPPPPPPKGKRRYRDQLSEEF